MAHSHIVDLTDFLFHRKTMDKSVSTTNSSDIFSQRMCNYQRCTQSCALGGHFYSHKNKAWDWDKQEEKKGRSMPWHLPATRQPSQWMFILYLIFQSGRVICWWPTFHGPYPPSQSTINTTINTRLFRKFMPPYIIKPVSFYYCPPVKWRFC